MRADAIMGLIAAATWASLIPLLIWKALRIRKRERERNRLPPMTNGYPDPEWR